MDKKEMNKKDKKEISKKAKKFIFPAVAAAVIIGGGFGYVAYAQIAEENQSQAELAKQATVSEEEAIKIALEQVPGSVEEVELEDENGTIVYEIEIQAEDGTEQEVEIDATTGEVVKVEAEDDEEDGDDDQSQAELAKQAKVTEEAAIKTALEQVPGSVEKVELDIENGTIVYEIEIQAEDGTDQEVEIDATTGDVVKVEAEDDDQSQAELAKQAKVIEEAAIKTALEQVRGTVEKVELEDENGTIVYDIDINAEDGTKQEVKIDTATGDVVKIELEDN